MSDSAKSPEQRISALEESVTKLQAGQDASAKSLTDLQASMDNVTKSVTTACAGVTKLTETIESLQSKQEEPKQEEPKAQDPSAPAAAESAQAGLTAEDLQSALAAVTKDLGGKIATIEGKLTEAQTAAEEAAKTKLPQVEGEGGPISSSASAGGDSSKGQEKPKTYDEVFAEDKEVNPQGWKTLAEAPRDQLGARARMKMEEKYGSREAFNKAHGLAWEPAAKSFDPITHVMQLKQPA